MALVEDHAVLGDLGFQLAQAQTGPELLSVWFDEVAAAETTEAVLRVLRKNLLSADEDLRTAAVFWLMLSGTRHAGWEGELVTRLTDTSIQVRRWAVTAVDELRVPVDEIENGDIRLERHDCSLTLPQRDSRPQGSSDCASVMRT